MSDYVQDFFTSRSNFADGNVRVGQEGRLWYDSITNTIRVGNGTPGGLIVSGGGSGTGSNLVIADEGTILTTSATSLNFVGNAVKATSVGSDVTVKISDSFLIFDGGAPDTVFEGSPALDCGGVV